jgi:hypothetical protein
MTQNEPTVEIMNEAIALFDGLTKHDDDRYAYPHFKNSKGNFMGYAHNIGYDADWNILMPVCHKIREKAFELRGNERAQRLLSKLNIQLMYGTRADVHLKAYQFIQWYQKQQHDTPGTY